MANRNSGSVPAERRELGAGFDAATGTDVGSTG
jgi:hypothetical protein